MSGLFQQFDSTIFNFINHQLANYYLDFIMVVITQFGNALPSGSLGLFLIRKSFKKDKLPSWIGALSGLAVGSIICSAIKYGVNRPRPAKSIAYLGEKVRLVNELLTKNSLPSGHTFTAFAIATIIAYFRPKLAFAAYLVAFLVGISRIYLAAHFPTDVLAGALLALITVWGGILISRKIQSSHK